MPVALGARVLTAEEPVATGMRVPNAEPDTVAVAAGEALTHAVVMTEAQAVELTYPPRRVEDGDGRRD